MLMLGLRLGERPRVVVTTTPKPTKLLRSLIEREGDDVVVVRGSTFDNSANLAPGFLQAIRERYEGTRLGRQELYAELLTDTVGALWNYELIEAARIDEARLAGADIVRIVVAIDPAVSAGEAADEAGIIVAARDAGGHAYVLGDLSGRMGPIEWARTAVAAYRHTGADRVVAEVNNGGAMVEATLRMVDPAVSYRAVHASRGKAVRAEPVAALYEQGRVHHVGAFPQLEDQMCGFTADFDRRIAGYSPDRVDALVWAITELLVAPAGGGVTFGALGAR
jgi:phage terminase large subunit-like protein